YDRILLMKKFLITLAVIATITPFAPVAVSAQTTSVDDSKIEQSLREKNLDQKPGVVEVEESTIQGQKPSSGFIDENGNPISQEQYDRMREDEKGVKWLNVGLVLGALAIVGGTIVAVVSITKNKKR